MSTTTGGTETSKTTTHTGSSVYGEVWSQGNASLASVASIPATPTGRGWVSSSPGAGTFATGNWSATFTLSLAVTGTDFTVRVFRYSAGTYTLIGTFPVKTISTTAKTAYAFTATSFSTITFAAGDLIYTDLWLHDTANVITDNPVVWESNSATAGVASDVQITTSTFTASGGTSSVRDIKSRFLLAKFRDIAARFRQRSANQLKDIVSRFILSISAFSHTSFAKDTFARSDTAGNTSISNAAGWGTASDGETWVESGMSGFVSATYSISGSTGKITSGTASVNFYAILGSGTLDDGSVVVQSQVSASWDYAGVVFRYIDANNCYRAYYGASDTSLYLDKVVSGVATTFATFTITAPSIATRYNLRLYVRGTTLKVRFWAASSAEPTTWQIDTTDASISGSHQYGTTQYLTTTTDVIQFAGFEVDQITFAKDITSRFRQRSANQLKDISARFRLTGSTSVRDVATRLRQRSLDQFKDVVARFSQRSANQLKDMATRLRLAKFVDVASRIRLRSANQLKDTPTRLRLAKFVDIATRLRLRSATTLKDIATRFRQRSAPVLRDMTTRLSLGLVPLGPTDGPWNLAFHDEFDDTTGMSGPTNGVQPSKWNTAWFTGPTAPGSGDTWDLSDPATPTEIQYYGPASLIFPGDGAIHLRLQAGVDNAGTFNGRTVESGIITTAGLMALNPANVAVSTSSPDLRPYTVNGKCVLEVRMRIPGPNASAGSYWPIVWLTNSGNYWGTSPAGTDWPLGRGYFEEIDVSEWYTGGSLGSGDLFNLHQASSYGGMSSAPSSLQTTDLSLAYHIYTYEFTTTTIQMWIDGIAVTGVNPSSSQMAAQWVSPQYLLINFCATAGASYPTTAASTPNDMMVDYVRVWRSTSLDEDIATRFRLKSADTPKDLSTRLRLAGANQQLKDVPTRFRQRSANLLRDLTSRLRLMSALSLKDIRSRVRLMSALQLKDVPTRLRLMSALQSKDITTRLKIRSANQLRDIASRFLLSGAVLKDIASRLRLMSASQLKDVKTRFRIAWYKDIASRLRLRSADQLKDTASRVRFMSALQNKDTSSRFIQRSADQLKDVKTRLRLQSAAQLRDLPTRLRVQSAAQLKDIASRLRLVLGINTKDMAARVRLRSANQLKDITSRLVLALASQRLKDITSRLRLQSAVQLKDVKTRLALSVLRVKDITTRVRLMSALQVKDTASRFSLRSANRLLDMSTRLRQMSALQTRDVSARLRQMSVSQLKDVVSRLRLSSAFQLKDMATRLRVRSANQLKDVVGRLRLLSQPQVRDMTARYRLSSAWQFKDVTSRLRQRSANQLRDVTLRLVLAVAQQRSKDVRTRVRIMSPPHRSDLASRLCLYERTPNADMRIRRGTARMRTRSGRAKVTLPS